MGYSGLIMLNEALSGASVLPPIPTMTNPVWAMDVLEYATLNNTYQDSAKTTLAAADGDVVGAEVPISGWGTQDAVQVTTANKPLLRIGANGINGKPALSFDGVNDFLNLTGLTHASGPYTIYIVTNPANTTGTQHSFFDTLTGRLIFTHITSTAGQMGIYDGSYKNLGASTTGAQLLTFTVGAGASNLYRNGTLLGTSTYTNTAIGGNVAIGARHDGFDNRFPGLIGAMYIQAFVDATERAAMEAAQMARWEIS